MTGGEDARDTVECVAEVVAAAVLAVLAVQLWSRAGQLGEVGAGSTDRSAKRACR